MCPRPATAPRDAQASRLESLLERGAGEAKKQAGQAGQARELVPLGFRR